MTSPRLGPSEWAPWHNKAVKGHQKPEEPKRRKPIHPGSWGVLLSGVLQCYFRAATAVPRSSHGCLSGWRFFQLSCFCAVGKNKFFPREPRHACVGPLLCGNGPPDSFDLLPLCCIVSLLCVASHRRWLLRALGWHCPVAAPHCQAWRLLHAAPWRGTMRALSRV